VRAVGIGLGAFLYYLVPDRAVYLVSLIPFFVGVVLLIHARMLTARAMKAAQ
jgi:hypothetical protein